MHNLDLHGTNLAGVNFSHCDMLGTNFAGANLKRANFASCSLESANFAGADLSEAYLLIPLARLNARLTRLAERIRRATLRQRLAFVFATLVIFLLALGLGQGG